MKKRILGLLIALSVSIPAFATIAVSPTRIEINANKIRNNYVTAAVQVSGDENQPVRYRAYSGYFTISDKGELVMEESNGDAHDISNKIRFVPSEFTVPPGKSQKLRVNIANIKNLPDGESRAILYLEDIKAKEVNVPMSTGIGAQLIVKTRIGVPVYVDKGKFVKKGEIETFEIVKENDGLYTQMKVLSTGNSKIRYTGRVQIIQGKKLIGEYHLEERVVGSENSIVTKQKIDLSNIKEAGDYTLRAILTYDDQDGNRKNIKKDAILKITGEI